jgi:GT2 family glycosyltransferase/SAM-dependent methyltransferase/glycosyltransferase involved in cell wall biosynthesis
VAAGANTEEGKPNSTPGPSEPTAPDVSQAGEPPRLIEWTGERCVPWSDDLQVVYEHYHRYLFATALASGRRVLDLATGEGYGAALLATQAGEVVAVDIDEASIEHARANYRLGNLTFARADILEPGDLADGSFDVVTCFEALEHVADHDRLLAEVLRLLTPDGVFVVSTPDRAVYSVEQGRENPFHVHELDQDEFVRLLEASFPHVRLWGQDVAVGSFMIPLGLEGGAGEVATLTREAGGWTPGVKPRPTYLFAVASRAELPPLPAYSTLVDLGLELVRDGERRHAEAQAEALRELRSVSDAALTSTQRLSRRAERLEQRQQAVLEELRAAQSALDASRQELSELTGSPSFRLLGRYRRLVERFAPSGTLRRGAYRYLVAGAIEVVRKSRPAPSLPAGPVAPDVPPMPTSTAPEVSIVIPVHNNWDLTAACLRSVAADRCAVAFEVVVVDDASTDDTPALLPQVAGVTAIRLDENVGFIGAVNAGVQAVSSQLVVLLNNDTIVGQGWLDALVDTAELEDDVGIVGAKLVYPDGRLQEAGGIIWRDGTGWNYGRGDDPDDPAFNFVRDVDYCSGACLLVRKEILDATGGLDTRYAPAYYEDTDLAFAARKLGYRVVYQPASTVCHVEGASNGTDESAGIKRYQEVNRTVFAAKWQAELSTRPENQPALVRIASRRAPNGRVLVVDDRVPMPNQDSGSRRMSELLMLLRDLGLAVTFVPDDTDGRGEYSARLRRAGIEVLSGPLDVRKLLRELAPGLDVALLSRPVAASHWQRNVAELCPTTKIIYDTVDLHFLREARRAEIEGNPAVVRAAARYYNLELSLATNADAVLVVSEEERDVLLREQPGLQVYVVPNVHRAEPAGRPFERRQGVLFVGSFPHPPNRDAARWLVNEIMPLVHRTDPDIPVYIVGSHPTDEIRALASDSVQVLGWVPDLRDLYDRARLSVAPLRYGAGVKGKAGESLAYGLPVVTTRLGAEGMGLEHEQDVLVADSAEAFAAEIVRAYRDAGLWTRLAANGRSTIARASSPATVQALLVGILSDIGVNVQRSGVPDEPSQPAGAPA